MKDNLNYEHSLYQMQLELLQHPCLQMGGQHPQEGPAAPLQAGTHISLATSSIVLATISENIYLSCSENDHMKRK